MDPLMVLIDNSSNCTHGIMFIHKYFGECIEDTRHFVAFAIGLSSIGFWLFAQTPQLIANVRMGNADSLSAVFLLQWLMGDALNLIGAILTNQLATQVITAYYFVGIDMVMMLQFIYYQLKRKYKKGNAHLVGRTNTDAPLKKATGLACVGLCLVAGPVSLTLRTDPFSGGVLSAPSHSPGRALMAVNDFALWNNRAEMIGYLLGVTSAVCYLSSRMPQIYKNFKRKSTGGLAFTMFLLAVCGNITYSLSIFLTSTDTLFLLKRMPWIVGSVGTLVFDFIIFSQFYMYRHSTPHPDHHHAPAPTSLSLAVNSEASEIQPLLPGPVPGVYVRPLPADYSPDEHQPISPLIFPAAQRPDYYM
eukprot:comp14744_c0_seq1/m.11144 comp14744_c0_seq1/g.11144  ORF comp14744_c0_seq1/g.11144 comp14744_c0_seq1/m.11144 type:complete len:360 (-) comp14744_c0_seq1:700-1779(-)